MGAVIHPSPKPADDFEAVYRRCFGFVWRSVIRLGVPPADLEDAVQEVFVVAFRRREDFDGRASVEAWLYGISRHVVRNRRRRLARRQQLWMTYGHRERKFDGEWAAERSDAAYHLHAFLEGLSATQRDAFILGELEQMTGREMGEALDISPNTAAARLRAARKSFARYCDALQEELPPDARDAEPDAEAEQRHWGLLLAAVPALGLDGLPAGSAAGTTGSAAAVKTSGWSGLSSSAAMTLAKSFVVTVGVGGGALLLTGAAVSLPTTDEAPRAVQVEAADSGHEVVSAAVASPAPVYTRLALAATPSPSVVDDHGSSEVSNAADAVEVPRPRSPRSRAKGRGANDHGGNDRSAQDQLAAETELLTEIRRAQSLGHHGAALKLARIHARRHRGGQLETARRRAEVRSLCALGRTGDAAQVRRELGESAGSPCESGSSGR